MNDQKIVLDKDGNAVNAEHANLDPITKEPGAHPVGTGLGAAGAGTAGAIVGAGLAGPLGGVVGAMVGAAAGGAWGHYAAEAANPTYVAVEPALRDAYPTRAYASDRPYDDYEEAYVFGANERARINSPWTQELENDLRARWDIAPAREGRAKMDWPTARPAIKDAWDVREPLNK